MNSILTPKGHLLVPPDKFEARSTICQIWKKKPYIALYMYILGPFFPKDLSSFIFQKSCPWYVVITVVSSLEHRKKSQFTERSLSYFCIFIEEIILWLLQNTGSSSRWSKDKHDFILNILFLIWIFPFFLICVVFS